jgi:iron(III) transport system ATP-binding protein
MSRVELKNIKKAYGSARCPERHQSQHRQRCFFYLLGPSGCGKTTLLRAIAGFHQQDAGDILVDGQSIGHLGANQRNVGMVFQDYAVFPHLSVFDNVAFGLVQQKVAPRTSANVLATSCRRCSSTSKPSACRTSSAAVSNSAWGWPARW